MYTRRRVFTVINKVIFSLFTGKTPGQIIFSDVRQDSGNQLVQGKIV